MQEDPMCNQERKCNWSTGTVSILFLLVLFMIPFTSQAQTARYWIGGNSEYGYEMWYLPNNWNTMQDGSGDPGIPLEGDNAYITNANSQIGFNATTLFLGYMGIDNNSSLTFVGFGNLFASTTQVGVDGVGTINMGWGSHTVDGDLYLGVNSGSQGNYIMGSGTLNVSGNTIIGYRGTGIFTQTGETSVRHTTGGLSIGGSGINVVLYEDGIYNTHQTFQGNGTYTLNTLIPTDTFSNLWATGDLVLGDGGTGTFQHTDGRVTVDGSLVLGRQVAYEVLDGLDNFIITEFLNGTGTYTLSGGELFTSSTFVGDSAAGTFNHNGGIHYIGVNPDFSVQEGLHELIVGRFEGSSGTYNLSGVGELYAKREIVGDAGFGAPSIGIFNQSGNSIHVINEDLIIGQDLLSSGTFALADTASLTVGGNVFLGDEGGIGIFTQRGGTATFNSNLFMGSNSEGGDQISTGTYNLSGGYLNVDRWVIIGENGNGYFTQEGGNFTLTGGSSDLYLGYNAGSYGEYNMTGGNLSVGWFYVGGESGEGLFNQSGGTVTLSRSNGEMNVGTQSGSVGTYSLSGAGILDASNVTLYVGHAVGSTGFFNQGGGTLTADWMDVGSGGTGTFTQRNGTARVNNVLAIGRETGSLGTYALSGNELVTLTTGETHVGASGTGTLTQSGGTFVQSGGTHATVTLVLGYNIGGTGTYNLSGGSLSSNYQRIGLEGTGIFAQTGGTNTITGHIILGQGTTSRGAYNLSGNLLSSTLTVADAIYVGMDGLAEFNQTGGTAWVGAAGYDPANPDVIDPTGKTFVGYSNGARGTYNLSGGTHNFGDEMFIGYNPGSTGAYNVSGTGKVQGHAIYVGTNGSTGTIDQSGADSQVLVGDIMGLGNGGTYNMRDGTLNAGALNNQGNFNYTGGAANIGTVENTGTFNVNVTSMNISRGFTQLAGILKGSGQINGNVTINGGTVTPGNSPGTLTINGNYTQGALGTLLIELGGTQQGKSDLLSITGSASLTGTLDIDLYDGYKPTVGDSFDILIANAILGIGDTGFQGFTNIIGPNGWIWTVQYLDGSTTDTVRLTANAVPIPGAVWFFAPALAGLIGLRRRFTK
jgi:fibronectin-binding autotransporter adhesin